MSSQQSDAVSLREFLLKHDGTDYGLTDEQLLAHIRRARAYIGGKRLSWHVVAAGDIRQGLNPDHPPSLRLYGGDVRPSRLESGAARDVRAASEVRTLRPRKSL